MTQFDIDWKQEICPIPMTFQLKIKHIVSNGPIPNMYDSYLEFFFMIMTTFLIISECLKKRHDVMSKPLLLGARKVECTDDGKFNPIQCHGNFTNINGTQIVFPIKVTVKEILWMNLVRITHRKCSPINISTSLTPTSP